MSDVMAGSHDAGHVVRHLRSVCTQASGSPTSRLASHAIGLVSGCVSLQPSVKRPAAGIRAVESVARLDSDG